jgi:hypothetical protein
VSNTTQDRLRNKVKIAAIVDGGFFVFLLKPTQYLSLGLKISFTERAGTTHFSSATNPAQNGMGC